MRSEVDVSKWSGEGTFTQLLIDCLRSMDAIEFVRVEDRKSTRLNSSHSQISYAVFCLKKKKKNNKQPNSTNDKLKYEVGIAKLLTTLTRCKYKLHYRVIRLHKNLNNIELKFTIHRNNS